MGVAATSVPVFALTYSRFREVGHTQSRPSFRALAL